MRALVAALALIFAAAPAAAREPRSPAGEWSTEWSASPGAAPVSADLTIKADAETGGLDGVWRAPGLDGIMYGEVEPGEGGARIWRGEWVQVAGATISRGNFELVFERDSFTGSWSAFGSQEADGMWRGRRRR